MTSRRAIALATGPLGWRSLAVLAAAIAVVAQLAMPVRLPAPDPLAATQPAASLRARPAAARPATRYPAIAEHPLFSPTRQPYVPPKAPPVTVAARAPLRDYLLLGTVVEGNTRIALIKPPGRHGTIRAVPGQTIAGWKLREIMPDALEFENGAARFALHFSNPRWPHP